MTRKRMLIGGAVLAATLAAGVGIAAAQDDPTSPTRPPGACTMHDGDMGDMGDMHAQMSAEMRAQCETMHARGGAMTDGGMMNGAMMRGQMHAES